ncbi:MAG: hypothetical protein AB1757_09665 [Acidobacteriota bacterium]
MEKTDLLDVTINQALSLAYFIHGDKTLALQIVTSALNKLEVAVQAQDKRLYYEPQGRTTARKARNRINYNEKHLLQRLIYLESEPYEKEKEREGKLDERRMITHFIKHLVKITLKRNSFYVALGISRLLHNYTTAEAMEIYNLVVQDPERARDDYYYRSRKGRLMQEMKERFGDLLNLIKVNRGEERFEPRPSSKQFNGFVFDCLDNFTPWATACVIPSSYNPFATSLKELEFDSQDPDAEHHIEINRTHTILHPDCFTRLVKALKLNPPNDRLEIPNFNLSTSATDNHRNDPPTFGRDELEAIKSSLDEQAHRRKRFSAGLLKVVVDGALMGEIDLQRVCNLQVEIAEGAELIEIIGNSKNEEVRLASCFIQAHQPTSKNTITLEGGQEITFSQAHKIDQYGEVETSTLNIDYRETRAFKAAALAINHRINRLGDALRINNLAGVIKPALAFMLVALLGLGVWFFAIKGDPRPLEQADHNQSSPQPENPEVTPNQSPDSKQADNRDEPNSGKIQNQDKQEKPQKPRKSDNDRLIASDRKPTNPEDADAVKPGTRSTQPAVSGLALSEIKLIGIQISCDDAHCQELRTRLIEGLSASNRFAFTNDLNKADALLKISDIRETPNDSQASVIARLANAKGFVLFPANRGGSGNRYRGQPAEVAQKIINDLLEESLKAAKHPAGNKQ